MVIQKTNVYEYRSEMAKPQTNKSMQKRNSAMSEEKQVSIQEIAVSNMVSIEALVRILVKRGFITKEEIVDEVKQVKFEQEAKRN